MKYLLPNSPAGRRARHGRVLRTEVPDDEFIPPPTIVGVPDVEPLAPVQACDYLTKTVRAVDACRNALDQNCAQLLDTARQEHKTARIVDVYRDALDTVEDDKRWRVNTQFELFLEGMMLMLEEDSPPRATKQRRATAATPETFAEDLQTKAPRPRDRGLNGIAWVPSGLDAAAVLSASVRLTGPDIGVNCARSAARSSQREPLRVPRMTPVMIDL